MTMKNIIKSIALCGCLSLGMGLTSCEDMMTVDTGDKAYTSANDTLYSYLGIMRAMQDIAERQVILGEIRGDLVTASEFVTDTLHAISNFEDPKDQSCSLLYASDYYNVINNCNFYIHNCDTSTVKANVKFMVPEYTQVKAIRAWVYLQLVKNYGEVPYITEPIKNLDVIKNFDYDNNLVNKDNLIDKLYEDGLAELVDMEYPHYGNSKETWGKWNNGAVEISARNCFIPIRLVLADAFLLRGANKSDYINAAQYYYSFLKKETQPMLVQAPLLRENTSLNNDEEYIHNVYEVSGTSQWGLYGNKYNYSTGNEVITSIPSSANAGLGKMLLRVAEVFGYGPTSSQQTDASTVTNSDGSTSTEYSASGAINVNPTHKRQYYPSFGFQDVNLSQTYIAYTELVKDKDPVAKYYEQQDSRWYHSYYTVIYDGERYKLCSKVASLTQFYYAIPVYRKNLIWLRLAEAINRAGYPEFAFAILKDGINQYTLPEVKDVTQETITSIDGMGYLSWANDTLTIYRDTIAGSTNYYYLKDGVLEPYTGKRTGFTSVTEKVRKIVYNGIKSLYYVTDSTRLNEFNSILDFNDEVWNNTYGIHANGAGYSYININQGFSKWDTDFLSTNISGQRDTVIYDYKKLIEKNLDAKTYENASIEDKINAIENVIVDELALETAFEGNRFTDLVRIAEHKEASGYKGKEWIANKIANRNTKQATKNSPAVEGFDASLYAKLKDPKNWYFSLPAWKQ